MGINKWARILIRNVWTVCEFWQLPKPVDEHTATPVDSVPDAQTTENAPTAETAENAPTAEIQTTQSGEWSSTTTNTRRTISEV